VRHNIYILFFSLITFSLFAQTKIEGKVTGPAGKLLTGAAVVLKNSEQKIFAYTFSAEDGSYLLSVKDQGEYILEVNFLGYKQETALVDVTSDVKAFTFNFSLQEIDDVLEAVVIEVEKPVSRHGDTLAYDAKALSTGHEVVVEDLLKNIPGITILEDGTIKYGEREIDKVMVDGEDLFNKGYSLLTKNMPTQPLDKIEVLQNYSKNKLLKGIEDSNAVALNLTIDEQFKNIWFGNLTAGYGNDNRYKANGNLMNFGKYYKNFFSFALNNAGYDNIGNISGMQNSSTDIETIGMGSRAVQAMHLSGKVSRIDEERARFNDSEMATFSSIMPLSDKIKVRFNGFLGFDELYSYQNAFIVRDFEGTYFQNTEINNSKDKLKKGYVSAYLNYDLSATQMLQSLSTFNSGNSRFNNTYIFNTICTREELETNNSYFDQQLTYTYKWKDRNIILLKSRFLTDRIPQTYAINDYLLGDLFPYENISAINNNVKSSMDFGGLEADFKLKQKNDDLIAFTVGYEYNHTTLASRFSLFRDSEIIMPPGFQSNATYSVGDLYAKSGYKWKIKKLSIGADLNAHQLFNKFKNIAGDNKKQNPFFINAISNATWEISPDNVLSAYYIYNVDNSNIVQVNDAYLLTSSRSFSKGLGTFNQFENSSANINYTTKHYLNRYSFSAGLSYSKQNDIITYRSQINQNSSLSEAFVMRGGHSSSIYIKSHFVIKKLKGSMAIDGMGSQNIYYNQINESDLRKNIIYQQVYSFGWRSSFKSDFNFNFRTEWNFTKIKSEQHAFNNTSKFSYLDLMYKVSDRLDVKAKAEHYNFGGLDTYNNYFFADFEAKYSFKKDKYSISLDGRNLFNTDEFTTYSVSDIGYSTNSYRLLPRYVMLSFMYRF